MKPFFISQDNTTIIRMDQVVDGDLDIEKQELEITLMNGTRWTFEEPKDIADFIQACKQANLDYAN